MTAITFGYADCALATPRSPAVSDAADRSAAGHVANDINEVSPDCPLAPVETGSVARRLSPLIFALADGRRIRLADIAITDLAATTPNPMGLANIVGRQIAFAHIAPKPARQPDRHGAFAVHARLISKPRDQDASPVVIAPSTWIQQDLIAEGQAWVAPDPYPAPDAATAPATSSVSNPGAADRDQDANPSGRSDIESKRSACLDALLSTERNRRPSHQPLVDANDLRAVSGLTGRFVILKGAPKRISRSRGSIYLNFGPNWRRDTTVKIPAELVRRWPAWADNLTAQVDTPMLVRGWLDWRNGPLLNVSHPASLTPLVHTAAPPGPGASP